MKKSIITLATIALAVFSASAQLDLRVTGATTVKKGSGNTPSKTIAETSILGKSTNECIYNYEQNTTTKEGEKTLAQTYVILQTDGRIAKFEDYTAYRLDSAATAGVEGPEFLDFQKSAYTNPAYFTATVYQNVPEGKMTVDDEVLLQKLSYEEPLEIIEWNLTGDTLTIDGYLCHKATGQYAGRTWNVWYTEEIPLSFGPWKLSGLPGLTLRAEDSEGIHNFNLAAFRNSSKPIVRNKDSRTNTTSRDKFVSFRNKNINANPDKNTITNVEVIQGGGILINGMPWRRTNIKFIPLELK